MTAEEKYRKALADLSRVQSQTNDPKLHATAKAAVSEAQAAMMEEKKKQKKPGVMAPSVMGNWLGMK